MADLNTLTPQEKEDGWTLLFDGKTLDGWTNYRSETVGEGWQVKDGVLSIADPSKGGGDLVTKEQFDWFELSIEFMMAPNSNSGIMFHVVDKGGPYSWMSGPEIQLYDVRRDGVQKAGWLYELYQSEVDTYKPAGEWNHLRLVIDKEGCATYLNGTKYYDFVLGSEDFKGRVARSKFREFPHFGNAGEGRIALQGDHGVVSFRNIKLKPLSQD